MPGDQNVSQATKPFLKPQRRQNTSCDRCRRSKRRCVVPSSSEGVSGTICTNCERLRHHCTFEFAKRHPSSPVNKRQTQKSAEAAEGPEHDKPNIFDGPIERLPDSPENQFNASSVADQDILAAWLNFDHERIPDDHFASLSNNYEASTPLAPARCDTPATTETQINNQISHSFNRMNTDQYAPAVPLSFKSPIYLLNTGIDAKILGDRLTRIYDAISTASSCSFLDYDCNLYATGNRYRIRESKSGSSTESPPAIPTINPHNTPNDRLPQYAPSIPTNEEIVHEISLLGSVRFLDHFSHLYGNRLDSNARRKSDAALKAVLLAFSMQWLPAADGTGNIVPQSLDSRKIESDSTLNAFTDAWLRARALLEDARHVKTFRVIIATLTFVGIVSPTKVRDMEGVVTHDFLDSALQKLCYLDGLVTQYREHLGPSSTYSALLEASLNLIRWTGYIRDTGAALATDRQCRIPELWGFEKVALNKESMPGWSAYQNILAFDGHVQGICLKASAETFSIHSSVAAIDQLNASFQPFIAHSISNFLYLSTCPRISIVSLVMFWNLGIFLLNDVFKNASKYLNVSDEQQLAPIIRKYQQDAALCVTSTVECVLNLPVEEAFNLQNGLGAEVPITAYHVTPSIAVTALQKAIEGVIQLQLHSTHDADLFEGDCRIPVPDGTWDRQIDVLMKGLMSLDVTIGGSQTSSMALRLLMQRYGDILSECWTSDFDT
ncbi:hypothetical protein PENARI_c007G04682 [Penicillium arizonense]|uniref:Zn(2)-C6 fungal-type domain-containing protein n=1 Tax=Penicillium arizonense TaxID=1835702 RepID=A0A1F5LL86_PENAI|nr:hypothetical protein PENARI_c007G04682 [Penicillium arizonense]OGE53770.1 hypothetical protein PENARI_c007G04682 [Penicillium arizonense]